MKLASLIQERVDKNIDGIKFKISLNFNFRNPILQFTFASSKEIDKYMEDEAKVKKSVVNYVKKLGFKQAHEKDEDLGGISIVLDDSELLKKIL